MEANWSSSRCARRTDTTDGELCPVLHNDYLNNTMTICSQVCFYLLLIHHLLLWTPVRKWMSHTKAPACKSQYNAAARSLVSSACIRHQRAQAQTHKHHTSMKICINEYNLNISHALPPTDAVQHRHYNTHTQQLTKVQQCHAAFHPQSPSHDTPPLLLFCCCYLVTC